MKRLSIFSILVVFTTNLLSQNTTIGENKSYDSRDAAAAASANKVLIIPFDEKLYLSEIDKKINETTNLSFEEIRNEFRKGIDFSLWAELKHHYNVYALLQDSAGNQEDMQFTYASIGWDYKQVGGGEEKEQATVQEGQLAVPVDYKERFMNAEISNEELLPYLTKKYGSKIFLFVNQLDILKDPTSYDPVQDLYFRKIRVHYTVMNEKGETITAGIASTQFNSNINHPQQIINSYFGIIAKQISEEITKALSAKQKK